MTTPTTTELTANIIAAIEGAISQTVPLLPRSFIAVLAKALAAVIVILYKRGDFIGLQWFVRTASTKETTFNGKTFTPLIEIGRQIGVSDPTPATQAELLIDITVENQLGQLEAGTQLIGSTNGVTYLMLAAVLLDAPTVQATVRASGDQTGGDGSGVLGNLQAGDTSIQFANPLPNVARTVLVDSQIVTGANAEDLDVVYRQRVLDRFQKRPQGGALADYEQWAEEVPGIINAYPYTGDAGEVDVFSEATPESSGSPDGIPTAAQLAAVLASIELDENGRATRRPANAFVNSLPITRVKFDVTVEGITGVNDLVQVESDVTSAVETYFLNGEPFINGLTLPPRRDKLTRSGLIGTVEDIVTASNGSFITVTFKEIVGPNLEFFDLGRGEKAAANTVVFI